MNTDYRLNKEYASYADEMHNGAAGYQPTWGLGLAEHYLTTENVDSSLVQLGNVEISEAQRSEDENRGGFAAMVCGY